MDYYEFWIYCKTEAEYWLLTYGLLVIAALIEGLILWIALNRLRKEKQK